MTGYRFQIARLLAAGLSCMGILLGGAVLLLGWGLGRDGLIHLFSGQPGMAASTAVALLICGVCTLFDALASRPVRRVWLRLCGVALVLLAALNLFTLLATGGRGLDHILFASAKVGGGSYMSPATTAFVLAAGVCLAMRRRFANVYEDRIFGTVATAGLIFSSIAVTGYVFDSSELKAIFIFEALSPHTALGFFLMFLAIVFSAPRSGWMRTVMGPGPGSIMLRRTLPAVILGSFLYCWVVLKAGEMGLFDSNIRLSILAISAACSLSLMLFVNTYRQNADASNLFETKRDLVRAVHEREILLKEVYHRVKNNLQFIDAMLAIESANDESGVLAARLADIQGRIRALGLVHQHLVDSQNLATLSLTDFLLELGRDIAKAAGFDRLGINLVMKIAPLPMDLDRAIPIGLIVTELMSNSVKHAYADGHEGELLVTADLVEEGQLRIVVADDGPGETPSATKSGQAGKLIVSSLVAQLGAAIRVDTEKGYRTTLTMPVNLEPEERWKIETLQRF